MTKREKVFNALVNCTSLHTSTTCLNCPYAAKLNEPVHYGDVLCTGALLRDCLIVMSEDAQKFNKFVEIVKNLDGNSFMSSDVRHGEEVYWFNNYMYEQEIDEIVNDLEKHLEPMKNTTTL